MNTQQPVWKLVGRVGDVDPIAYGGGFVYEDETGIYPPEMTWIEEDWEEGKAEGKSEATVYRIVLESDPKREWWYEKLGDVAKCGGLELADLEAQAEGSTMERAGVYEDLIRYFSPECFDAYPDRIRDEEAYVKFAKELA